MKRHGFTLIELIIVIAIIGILAATALPRFFDLTGKAKEAATRGSLGALRSALILARSCWLANGSPGAGVLAECGNINYAASGYPTLASVNETGTNTGSLIMENGDIPDDAMCQATATNKDVVGAFSGTPTQDASCVSNGWLYDAATGAMFATAATTL